MAQGVNARNEEGKLAALRANQAHQSARDVAVADECDLQLASLQFSVISCQSSVPGKRSAGIASRRADPNKR